MTEQEKQDMTLADARVAIDGIDREMAELFCRRMQAVAAVAAYKQAHGLPIYDPEREETIIRRGTERMTDATLAPYYADFLRSTMRVSRQYQRRLLSGMRVAFSGVPGAFAAVAAERIFPDAETVPFPDFRAAYDAVTSGTCDVAVLPIENSTAGEVGAVLDMIFSGPLFVNGIYDLPVTHCLLGVPGAQVSEIRTVLSHPQALAQCAPYLRAHGVTPREAENTAVAAQTVAQQGDRSVAAIACEETASLYHLEIIEKGINSSAANTTRFAVLAAAPAPVTGDGTRHSILMFTVRNEAGSLARAIDVIGRYGYNMRCLRSRPMKELLWQYYFYVELEGDLGTGTGRQMLDDLSRHCDHIRAYGTFRYPACIGRDDTEDPI